MLFVTALGALCSQLMYRLAWCHEHSAVVVTELLQSLDLAHGTHFWSSCAIQTSPTNCLDNSWIDTFFREAWTWHSVTSDIWHLSKTVTYLPTVKCSFRVQDFTIRYSIIFRLCECVNTCNAVLQVVNTIQKLQGDLFSGGISMKHDTNIHCVIGTETVFKVWGQRSGLWPDQHLYKCVTVTAVMADVALRLTRFSPVL